MSWAPHPSTAAAASLDHVAHLSSDLGFSLQLLKERVTFLFLMWFLHGLPSPSFACLWLPLGLDCIWPRDAGCLPALCGRPSGDLSPIRVLCRCKEIWGAAEQRDSKGPLSLLRSSIMHNRSGFASHGITSRALCVVGPSFHGLEFCSAIMFAHAIALSYSNKSGCKTEPK